jgi:hypothetical protein
MDKNDCKNASNTSEKHSVKLIRNKWDKYLDDYNNYLKEYIKHYKKSLKGNIASLSKYAYMKAKSLALYERLLDAKYKSILTEKQIKRISKIQMKIISTCKINEKSHIHWNTNSLPNIVFLSFKNRKNTKKNSLKFTLTIKILNMMMMCY